MIDPIVFNSLKRKYGVDTEKELDPLTIQKNKQLLEAALKKNKRAVNISQLICMAVNAVVISFLAFFVPDLNSTEAIIIVIIVCVLPTVIFTAFYAKAYRRIQRNACPRCFAMDAWQHLSTQQTGTQQTTIRKQVETKHYAPEKRFVGKPGAEFMPQFYQGKSVTTVNAAATRYNYTERYICKCCGMVRAVNTSRVVEN